MHASFSILLVLSLLLADIVGMLVNDATWAGPLVEDEFL
jgi:hypothetical protein